MIYDELQAGSHLGQMELDLDLQTVTNWRSLFPPGVTNENASQIPAGFIAVIAMRAYTHICPVRPPGNIHGEQSYEIFSLPEIGSRVITELICKDKAIKRERRWITFETRTYTALGKAPLFNGVMKIAWSS